MVAIAKKITDTLELVKFSHSVFALPFALVSMLVAAGGVTPPLLILKIILCMVLARTAAMAFNRVVDADIDAKNPRTQNRHIPAGLLSKQYVIGLCAICTVTFISITYTINALSFYLAPVAVGILFLYSLAKRFTHYTQLFLGLALGSAPIAAWIAVRGAIALAPLVLGLAVLFWVAGFDLIYATNDYEFDKANGVKSLVVKWGPQKALKMAQFFHLLFLLCLILFAKIINLETIGWLGTLLVGGIILAEHFIVDLNNPEKINAAFFTANGLLSMVYLLFVASAKISFMRSIFQYFVP